MASSRVPRLHTLVRTQTQLFQLQQRRWAQVHDVRFLATHRDPQQVLDRYKHKLDQKAKQEGHDSVESLKEAYKDKIAEYRRKASTVATPEPSPASSPTSTKPSPSSTPTHPTASSPIAAAARAATDSNTPGIKPLSSYLNLEKILTLPPKEIETLWRLRHANNARSICAVIPLETYQRMATAARSNPQFILPLPRQSGSTQSEESAAVEGGADIHFLQWGFHPPAASSSSSLQTANTHTSTVVFTHLAAYKLHGSYAQPHTTITHHLDLADEKGLVLMHGQVMPDSGVSVSEASWLVSCVQRFYDFDGEGSGRKGELLRMFTRGDVEGFKIEDLVSETETLS
ncbi:F1F0 ATP synthase assembly protein Atp11, putative [Talaromyces stipitatus ATCC 10500]|uniref:F1F0 ATP synthase assembly protein Atp11, putative n=1 Tax=Talaromyces stipitatus (strain ATCC 10500 / CBS 375.48 / QM 6759 / NRRL 1006) TaxID=441959 RepID=B8MBC4_TALSN|nr:F1F0 ATP synthase assembly protein Atp11, putative [Talaromyces stipitatus ATCC 10500]EED18913.1 F1F0 ATP synthase assembly protein Atp11, putative [Talaromyces stipitatus ATCC 10500]